VDENRKLEQQEQREQDDRPKASSDSADGDS